VAENEADSVHFKGLSWEDVTDLDQLRVKIGENLKSGRIIASQIADFFFGMKILLMNVEAPEVDGISDRIESEIKSTPGVSDMEILMVSRKIEVWKEDG
jgi:translation elongation factor EF-1beta